MRPLPTAAAAVLLAAPALTLALPFRLPSFALPRRQSPSPQCDSGPAPAAGQTVLSTNVNINPALVPEYGVARGTNADMQQVGSCDGRSAAGATVLIPCFCPPDRATFIYRLAEAVAAGNVLGEPVEFSNDAADMSEATVRARATAAIVLLQSFNGTKGVGCPAASAPDFLRVQSQGRM